MSVSDAAGNPADVHADADRRHGLAGRRDHRRRDGDHERRRPDDRGNLRRRARHDRHGDDRRPDDDDARCRPTARWNATPAFVGEGTWPVLASAADPAGNVGSADADAHDRAAPRGGGSTARRSTGSVIPARRSAAHARDVAAGGGGPRAPRHDHGRPRGSQRVEGPVLSIATKVTAPAKGAVAVTASGSVKIKGVKKAIKLASKTVKLAAGQSADAEAQADGQQEGVEARRSSASRRPSARARR